MRLNNKYIRCFFILFTIVAVSQTPTKKNISIRDSLLTVYTICEDVEQAKASYHLSLHYKDVDMDTSLQYAEVAKKLSLLHKDYGLYARSLKRLGVIYMYSEDTDLAYNYFNRAKRIANDEKDYFLIADIQSDIGLLFQRKSDYKESLNNLMEAYYFFKDEKPSVEKHKSLNRLGILYSKLNKNDRSVDIFSEALDVAILLGEKDREITSYINLAVIETQVGNFEKAIALYKKILNKSIDDNLTYQNQKRTCYNNLAFNYYKVKKYDSSLVYANKSLAIKPDKLFDSRVGQTYRTLGNVYLDIGVYKKAEYNLNKALSIAEEYEIKTAVIDAYKDLCRYHKKTENYKEALEYYEKFTSLESKLLNENFSEQISKIESSKVIEQKDVAYASLSKEKAEDKKEFESDIERIIWIVSLVLIAIIGMIVLYVYRNRVHLAEKQKQISTMKLFALRSQMNPHFIFNTINGVQNSILKSDKFSAYNYLSKFSQSIRLILDNSNDSFIRLQKELDLIRVYVDLEKIRFRNKLDFTLKVDHNIEEQNPYIPAMILQPIIENSIIHGISNKPEGGLVSLIIAPNNDNLKIIIEDNGIGREEAKKIKMSKPKGFVGITSINTKQRVDILVKSGYKDARYYFEDLFDDSNEVKGTRSILILPLKNMYDKNN
ncbi:Tetratricopeptide repeat-containing protein [Aquimarina amphilecti]|uniref:Tetratricopeptide repeat-containing protein n=1 Tax=Aquimarina amphilecti TaxID=1038014 RepID=A0A1H7MX80_AQUAM|nr:tetratricopeptide repeat protein [Aquimarina amphilecti]SEL15305.1 Tetratricopeptide repeat-containing protein [Aquimarina amphilecti]